MDSSIRNDQIVTLQDIADRCHVSKVTVSRALRMDRKHTSEELIKHIQAVALEMGYNPAHHHAARRLALRKIGRDVTNRTIAFEFPPEFHKYNYFYSTLRGILETSIGEGYSLLTVSSMATPEPSLPPAFARGDVDGYISLARPRATIQLLSMLRNEANFGNRPVVSLIEPVEGCSNVLADDYTGAYAAISHLLDLGHRYFIHFYASPYVYPHVQRERACEQACRDQGLDPQDHVFAETWIRDENYEEDTPPEDYMALLLKKHPEVTAILARNDEIAAQIYYGLARNGVRVPEDISLIGFDDTDPLLNDQGSNILTTVRIPLADIGKKAAEIVIEATNGTQQEDQALILPTELIIRNSTAAPKGL